MKRIRAGVRWEYLFIGLFFLIAFAYVLFRRDDIYIAIHDNLDSNIAWYKMLKDHHLFFEMNVTVPFLGGSNRDYLASNLKCYNWLYMLFPTFWAFIIGYFLKIIMSMFGFVILGKILFPDSSDKIGTFLFCGFLYGLLPTFPTSGFSFASLPLLVWLVLKLHQQRKIRFLFGFFLYPMLSGATTFGVFCCGFILVFFFVDWVLNKKPAWRIFAAVFVLGIGYAVTEWRLFNIMLFSNVESVRSSIATGASEPLIQTIKTIAKAIYHGHYHSGSLHGKVVLWVCAIYFFCLNISYLRKREPGSIFKDYFNWLMAWIVFNCVIYGVDGLQGFRTFIATLLPPLAGFSFARTLWLNPFLWYFAFMIVLCKLRSKALRNVLLVLAFCVLCTTPATYNFLYTNIDAAVYELQNDAEYEDLSYREFYSVDLFEEIKADIDYGGEWSAAFGMHPAVLEYNTISTLDGYLSFYPVEYKLKFRELIEPALENDEENRSYFDDWGGRAYLFSSEIDQTPLRTIPQTQARLEIDSDVFREMGGKYVFSRVSVTNAEELNLQEIGVYTHEESPYTIYVYELT